MARNSIDYIEVFDFKEKWCNENSIIIKLIKEELKTFFLAPILDVGAGTCDIALGSLQEKVTYCIDINEFPKDIIEVEKHKKICANFFDYTPEVQISTVLISHTLQFIDEDVNQLQRKINDINPKNVIIILNDNDDFLKKILDWTYNNCEEYNPEIHIPNFLPNYSVIKEQNFTATLNCPSFEDLAKQVSYLMLFDYEKYKETLVLFLSENLAIPSFDINQTIFVYGK